MFHIALFEPKMPANTGNIIRLAANTGSRLHLIEPLAFDLEEKKLRRAGLDYHDLTRVTIHKNYEAFLEAMNGRRVHILTTKGSRPHTEIEFKEDDVLLFGSETAGLPDEVRNSYPPEQRLRIPMAESNRSLNLSNSVAIVVYEAWRQLDFAGGS